MIFKIGFVPNYNIASQSHDDVTTQQANNIDITREPGGQ